MKKSLITASLMLATITAGMAGNPILSGYADPHMKVWGDKMYISVGKDETPQKKGFSMIYWDIYSSSDLVNWKLESHIEPKDTYIGKEHNACWASDISTRNGKYYFYFSNGGNETGLQVADKPDGAYKDVLKRPFIASNYSVNHEYDPTIFVDDDGSQYIIFGRDGQLKDHLIHYQIAKLSDDMLSFAEKPRDLMTDQPYGFGDKDRARDHQYFHKYNGVYYLSCAGAYMTSKNIYGPYSNERHTGQNGHTSFCNYNGQSYHMYEWTCEPFANRSYRQVCMTYLHYKDNGDMISDPDFLQETSIAKEGRYYKTGVGNYDAAWDKIQSEWFFKRDGKLVKRESPNGGFEIQNIHNGDHLVFPNIANLKAKSIINFSVSSDVVKSGKIEIRANNPQGKLLGTCNVDSTGAWQRYKTISCVLNNAAGVTDLCFVFRGGDGELMRLDWFNLE